MSNTTSYDHEYEYLDYQGGPFAVAIKPTTTPGKIAIQFCRGNTILTHMELNRTAALEIAGLILEEVRYLDHKDDVANR